MILNCLECGQPFHTVPALIKRGGGKYCSKFCSGMAHRTSEVHKCPQCGKEHLVKPCYIKRGIGEYCSSKCANTHRKEAPYARFLRQIEKTEDCWLWRGHIVNNGYGHLWDGERAILVHRYAYEQAYGPIPNGLFVCHHCDVKVCVRPDHLFLGTTDDNMSDMVNKGRQRKGDNHPSRKLSSGDVQVIRKRYLDGGTSQNILALEFGVTKTNIRQIVKGRTWKQI